ncbi:GNAT family N-acetyltransferase [Chitinophaga defluvii]|uniref:GNAT family protein n=1 Tax=Chitinophaga defluvii TaxID=3163343 RepID=A0ABV2TCF8_9BACT
MQQLLRNGQELVIRPATLEDAPALLDNLRIMTRETDFLLFSPEEAMAIDLAAERAFIQSYLDHPNHLLLLALVEGKVVGSVTVNQGYFAKQAHRGEFGIGVQHAYWNMGIGRRLITATLRWATTHPQLEILHFSAFANNEKAIQLYRNFDFQEHGRIPQGIRHKDGSYVDLVVMSRRVK